MNDGDERTQKYRNDLRSTDDLIRLALTKDADADRDEYWHPVWALQHRLPHIMETVGRLTQSVDAKARETAATILGQNGVQDKLVVSQSVDLLLGMIRQETDPDVLSSIAHAIGHLKDDRCIDSLLLLRQHPNAAVRFAVVHGLSWSEDPRAIEALITLSADQDPDVRNWATFGIGSLIETDTPEIREALMARLTETDGDIRGEALVGLAERCDFRVVAPLVKDLDSLSPHAFYDFHLMSTAAECVISWAQKDGDQRWLPVLEKLQALQLGNALAIQAAIERCTPKAP